MAAGRADDRVAGRLGAVVDRLVLACGWALVALAALVGFEVVARKFFLYSTKGVDEIGGYVLAISATVGFSYAVLEDAHVRVDLLLARCRPPWRGVLDLVAHAGLCAFSYVVLWRAGAVLARTWSLDARATTPLETPLIYPQSAWCLALALFAVVSSLALARAVRQATGAGAPGLSAVDREIAGEAADARRRGVGTERGRR